MTAPAPAPLVSVLVATYNGERYLDQTLAAIEHQTYANIEVLVRDDASSDSTAAIARAHMASDKRIALWANKDNVGVAQNYMLLVEQAAGEYVKWVNQDDLLLPGCVERLVAPLVANREVALATSRRSLIDADGNTLPDFVSTQPLFARDQMVDGMSLGNLCLRHNLNFIGEPSIVLYRNGVLPPAEMFTYGGRSFWINSDLVLWLKLLACGPAYYVAQPLSCFRVHDGQISARSATPVRGAIEWAHLIDTAETQGYLADRALAKEARCAFIRTAGSVAPSVGDESLLRQLMVSVAEQAARVVAGDQPICSIVIPLCCPASEAEQLIRRLALYTPGHLFDAVLVHDATDQAMAALMGRLAGDFQILGHPGPVDFGQAAQKGRERARGRHVVVLRAVDEIGPGWLQARLSGRSGDPVAA